jgi:MATE family multidrug resistance protein
MIFGAFYPLMNAFAGFYVGIGKTRFLIYLAILANLVNVLFDWMFIFGVKNFIPEMGIKGAGIATCLGTIFQAGVLAILFLRPKNRITYGSNKWKLNLTIFKKCFKVGFPPAIYYALEVFGWALFYMMMTTIGELHITVSSICQSVILLLWFFFDGIARGITALAGNFIGAKRIHLVHSLVKASLKLLVIFMAIISIFMIIDPKILIDFLIPGNIETRILEWKTSSGIEFYSILRLSLIFVFSYLLFEGIRWIFAGLLTAAGDTWFLLITGSMSVWLFLLLPVYFIVVKYSLAVQYAWLLAAIYAVLLSLFYYLRFIQGKWKNISLVEENIADE